MDMNALTLSQLLGRGAIMPHNEDTHAHKKGIYVFILGLFLKGSPIVTPRCVFFVSFGLGWIGP